MIFLDFFNQLSGFVSEIDFQRLIVAPKSLRSSLLEKIDREIRISEQGRPALIRFKLNSLLDEQFVAALYRASQAGVKVEIFVRGICAIKPGMPLLSKNVSVRSFLGRFLEHSRVYHFHNDGKDEYWLGSADLMNRNLDRRIETLIRLDQQAHKNLLSDLLDLYGSELVKHWEMDATGNWILKAHSDNGEPLIDIQERLIEVARERSK